MSTQSEPTGLSESTLSDVVCPAELSSTLYLTQINYQLSTDVSTQEQSSTVSSLVPVPRVDSTDSYVERVTFVSGVSRPSCTHRRRRLVSSPASFQTNLVVVRLPGEVSKTHVSCSSTLRHDTTECFKPLYVSSVSDDGRYSQGISFYPSRKRYLSQTSINLDDNSAPPSQFYRLSSVGPDSQKHFVSHIYIHSRGTSYTRSAGTQMSTSPTTKAALHEEATTDICVGETRGSRRMRAGNSPVEDSSLYNDVSRKLTQQIIEDSFRVVSETDISSCEEPDTVVKELLSRKLSASDEAVYEVAVEPSETLYMEMANELSQKVIRESCFIVGKTEKYYESRDDVETVNQMSAELAAEPVAVEPVAVEPVAVEPVAVEPVAVEPVAVELVAVEPVAVEPVAVEPVAVEPVAAEPVAAGYSEAVENEVREEKFSIVRSCCSVESSIDEESKDTSDNKNDLLMRRLSAVDESSYEVVVEPADVVYMEIATELTQKVVRDSCLFMTRSTDRSPPLRVADKQDKQSDDVDDRYKEVAVELTHKVIADSCQIVQTSSDSYSSKGIEVENDINKLQPTVDDVKYREVAAELTQKIIRNSMDQLSPSEQFPSMEQFPPTELFLPIEQFPPTEQFPPMEQFPPTELFLPIEQFPPTEQFPPMEQFPPTELFPSMEQFPPTELFLPTEQLVATDSTRQFVETNEFPCDVIVMESIAVAKDHAHRVAEDNIQIDRLERAMTFPTQQTSVSHVHFHQVNEQLTDVESATCDKNVVESFEWKRHPQVATSMEFEFSGTYKQEVESFQLDTCTKQMEKSRDDIWIELDNKATASKVAETNVVGFDDKFIKTPDINADIKAQIQLLQTHTSSTDLEDGSKCEDDGSPLLTPRTEWKTSAGLDLYATSQQTEYDEVRQVAADSKTQRIVTTDNQFSQDIDTTNTVLMGSGKSSVEEDKQTKSSPVSTRTSSTFDESDVDPLEQVRAWKAKRRRHSDMESPEHSTAEVTLCRPSVSEISEQQEQQVNKETIATQAAAEGDEPNPRRQATADDVMRPNRVQESIVLEAAVVDEEASSKWHAGTETMIPVQMDLKTSKEISPPMLQNQLSKDSVDNWAMEYENHPEQENAEVEPATASVSSFESKCSTTGEFIEPTDLVEQQHVSGSEIRSVSYQEPVDQLTEIDISVTEHEDSSPLLPSTTQLTTEGMHYDEGHEEGEDQEFEKCEEEQEQEEEEEEEEEDGEEEWAEEVEEPVEWKPFSSETMQTVILKPSQDTQVLICDNEDTSFSENKTEVAEEVILPMQKQKDVVSTPGFQYVPLSESDGEEDELTEHISDTEKEAEMELMVISASEHPVEMSTTSKLFHDDKFELTDEADEEFLIPVVREKPTTIDAQQVFKSDTEELIENNQLTMYITPDGKDVTPQKVEITVPAAVPIVTVGQEITCDKEYDGLRGHKMEVREEVILPKRKQKEVFMIPGYHEAPVSESDSEEDAVTEPFSDTDMEAEMEIMVVSASDNQVVMSMTPKLFQYKIFEQTEEAEEQFLIPVVREKPATIYTQQVFSTDTKELVENNQLTSKECKRTTAETEDMTPQTVEITVPAAVPIVSVKQEVTRDTEYDGLRGHKMEVREEVILPKRKQKEVFMIPGYHEAPVSESDSEEDAVSEPLTDTEMEAEMVVSAVEMSKTTRFLQDEKFEPTDEADEEFLIPIVREKPPTIDAQQVFKSENDLQTTKEHITQTEDETPRTAEVTVPAVVATSVPLEQELTGNREDSGQRGHKMEVREEIILPKRKQKEVFMVPGYHEAPVSESDSEEDAVTEPLSDIEKEAEMELMVISASEHPVEMSTTSKSFHDEKFEPTDEADEEFLIPVVKEKPTTIDAQQVFKSDTEELIENNQLTMYITPEGKDVTPQTVEITVPAAVPIVTVGQEITCDKEYDGLRGHKMEVREEVILPKRKQKEVFMVPGYHEAPVSESDSEEDAVTEPLSDTEKEAEMELMVASTSEHPVEMSMTTLRFLQDKKFEETEQAEEELLAPVVREKPKKNTADEYLQRVFVVESKQTTEQRAVEAEDMTAATLQMAMASEPAARPHQHQVEVEESALVHVVVQKPLKSEIKENMQRVFESDSLQAMSQIESENKQLTAEDELSFVPLETSEKSVRREVENVDTEVAEVDVATNVFLQHEMLPGIEVVPEMNDQLAVAVDSKVMFVTTDVEVVNVHRQDIDVETSRDILSEPADWIVVENSGSAFETNRIQRETETTTESAAILETVSVDIDINSQCLSKQDTVTVKDDAKRTEFAQDAHTSKYSSNGKLRPEAKEDEIFPVVRQKILRCELSEHFEFPEETETEIELAETRQQPLHYQTGEERELSANRESSVSDTKILTSVDEHVCEISELEMSATDLDLKLPVTEDSQTLQVSEEVIVPRKKAVDTFSSKQFGQDFNSHRNETWFEDKKHVKHSLEMAQGEETFRCKRNKLDEEYTALSTDVKYEDQQRDSSPELREPNTDSVELDEHLHTVLVSTVEPIETTLDQTVNTSEPPGNSAIVLPSELVQRELQGEDFLLISSTQLEHNRNLEEDQCQRPSMDGRHTLGGRHRVGGGHIVVSTTQEYADDDALPIVTGDASVTSLDSGGKELETHRMEIPSELIEHETRMEESVNVTQIQSGSIFTAPSTRSTAVNLQQESEIADIDFDIGKVTPVEIMAQPTSDTLAVVDHQGAVNNSELAVSVPGVPQTTRHGKEVSTEYEIGVIDNKVSAGKVTVIVPHSTAQNQEVLKECEIIVSTGELEDSFIEVSKVSAASDDTNIHFKTNDRPKVDALNNLLISTDRSDLLMQTSKNREVKQPVNTRPAAGAATAGASCGGGCVQVNHDDDLQADFQMLVETVHRTRIADSSTDKKHRKSIGDDDLTSVTWLSRVELIIKQDGIGEEELKIIKQKQEDIVKKMVDRLERVVRSDSNNRCLDTVSVQEDGEISVVEKGGKLVEEDGCSSVSAASNELCNEQQNLDNNAVLIDSEVKQSAGSMKLSKTDGRTLLLNTANLRQDPVSDSEFSAAVVGFAIVEPASSVPVNDFFTAGRVFAVRVKFSKFPGSCLEQGSRAGFLRMSVKFSDHDTSSPLDLLLQTGHHAPYFNTNTMDQFYGALKTGEDAVKYYLQSLPICLESAVGGVRFNADSFTDQYYYSYVIYEFKSTADDKNRLARFRAVPMERKQQTGKLTDEQQLQVWNYLSAAPGFLSKRPESYLHDELVGRLLRSETISYRLQIQVHEIDGDVTPAAFNPCCAWSEPWLDLASLTLSVALPALSIHNMLFDINCLPLTTLSLPTPADSEDFNSLAAVEHEMSVLKLKRVASVDETSEAAAAAAAGGGGVDDGSVEMTDYLVHCVTGDRNNAGTSANISVSIVGVTGRTPYIKLLRRTKTELDRANRATFVFQERPVGVLRYIQIYNEGQTSDSNWFLCYIVLSTPYNNKCYTLPCYRWVVGRSVVTLRDGAAITVNREVDKFMQMLRTVETSDRQQQMKWFDQSHDPLYSDLPGYVSAGNDINMLPVDLLTDSVKEFDKHWTENKAGKFSLFKSFTKMFSSRKGNLTVEFEKSLADTIQEKYQNSKQLVQTIRRWREDEEFALQLLNCTEPSLITRLESLPSCFVQVTDNLVRDQLEPERTLLQELNEGRLFMISYPHLEQFAKLCFLDDADGLPQSPKQKPRTPVVIRYVSSPCILLYNRQGSNPALIPLAIRLTADTDTEDSHIPRQLSTSTDVTDSTPSTPVLPSIPAPHSISPVFTRRDNIGDEYTDWLVAKMWVRVADVHYRLLGSLVGSRLLAETVSLAVYRSLPSVHPVYKLLAPHLVDVTALNTVYRRYVLDPSLGLADVLALGDRGRGFCIRFIAALLQSTTLESMDLRKNFTRLGLTGDSPAGYWYRDDALTLWDAIWKFVEEVLLIYYRDSAAVQSDTELDDLLRELHQQHLASLGLGEQFKSVEELTQFVTVIIFICTVQQSTIRRSMVDVYSYCPNAPPCMMTPPPNERHPDGYTEQEMRDMLPSPELVEKFIDHCMMLAGDDKLPKVRLGCYKDKLFTEEAALKAIDKFGSRLRQISDNIRHRHKSHSCALDYLLPENISQCYCA